MGLMLPIGFTGKVTVIPIEEESRVEMLWFSIPQDDEIVPPFRSRAAEVGQQRILFACCGCRRRGTRATSARGPNLGEVPTPFDELTYKDFI